MNEEVLQPKRCAELLRTMAEPVRLSIVHCLREGPCNVSELAQRLDSEIVNVSHHLRVLWNAGLVLDQKRGRFVVYQLHPDVFHVPTAANRLSTSISVAADSRSRQGERGALLSARNASKGLLFPCWRVGLVVQCPH